MARRLRTVRRRTLSARCHIVAYSPRVADLVLATSHLPHVGNYSTSNVLTPSAKLRTSANVSTSKHSGHACPVWVVRITKRHIGH